MRTTTALILAVLWGLTAPAIGQERLHVESIAGNRPLAARFTPAQLAMLEKLNRVDAAHLLELKTILVPTTWETDELAYAPLPARDAELESFATYLVVDLRIQAFGAYEHGALVRWGPISSGAKDTPTPSGLFHLNWRARSRVSTVDPSWLLTWYFNFGNHEGLALHQYELPGLPASHGCVRLLERDAQWVYEWGQSWKIGADGRPLTGTGTPVQILGEYDFAVPPPWLRDASREISQ